MTKPKIDTFQPKTEGREGHIVSSSAPLPVGPYPHARAFGDLLFLSGVGPRVAGSDNIPGVSWNEKGDVVHDVVLQTESVISNVRKILEASGSSLEGVIDVQVFLTNMERDFKAFNQVYAKHFEDIGATRTTIEVGALPTPICVEFKVIAALKK